METIVLKRDEAIAWLKREASQVIDDYTNADYDAEDVADNIKDLLEDIDIITEREWEWVAIEECPMSPSGINVAQMKRSD